MGSHSKAAVAVAAHAALDTGVHGVGASTVCSETEAAALIAAAIAAISEFPVSAVGDILEASSDAEKSTNGTADVYIKAKEIKLGRAGAYRIKFELKHVTSAGKARIYRNGTPVGTEWSTTTSYVLKSEDIAGWSIEDLCQIWTKRVTAAQVFIQNFQIYTDNPVVAAATLD